MDSRTNETTESAAGKRPQKPWPQYRCHKVVGALKIAKFFTQPDGSLRIQPRDEGYSDIVVSAAFADKHNPVAGGRLVKYEDGYMSYSPAEPFDDGYTLVECVEKE